MLSSVRKIFPVCLILAAAAAAQDQPPPQLTARELFYNAGNAPTAAHNAPAKKAAAKPAAQQTAQPTARTAPTAQRPPVATSSTATGVSVIPAVETVPQRSTAPAPSSGSALGLKYAILKLSGDSMVPAPPDSVFHAGDKIQFSVETNGPGYLYIVSQGSSGAWRPMFPSPEIEGGSNFVEGFHTYTFPPRQRFAFDQQAGEERVFIILSRDAKPDFEQLVYSLRGAKPAAETNPQPADPAPQVLRASIDGATVGRLHEVYARDLVIEKLGDEASTGSQEKAVYVVNASGSSDSCVVADLRLVHQ
jgi:hypothetical protein